MSSFFTLETQSLFMVTGEAAQSTPRPNAARASETPVRSARRTSDRVTERADSTRSRSGSRVSTASTSPALKALAHGPPMPPPPPRKASPVGRRQHTLRRRSSPAVPSSRSRSPSTSASDSEDDFVYVLPHVSTAEEAVARIRAVQQPREERRSRFFGGGGGGGSAASLMEHVATSPDRRRTPKKMKGGLPATMEEFYECPRYTVSLTAARDAIFSDALSGFHSYVAREEAQRERLRTLQHHHQTQQDHRGKAPGTVEPPAHHLRSLDTRAGTARTSAIPSFSQAMTQEWSTALAASSAPTTDSGGPPAEARNCTHEGVDGWRTGATPSAAPNPTPSPATVAETSKAGSGGGGGGGGDVVPEPSSPRVPASYMFLMRSRDTEAMSPLSPGHTAEPGSAASECLPASAASAHVTSTVHADPATSASPSAERRETTHGGPSQGRETEQAVRLELMQLHALLQERLYQRARVPEVFRYRYSTDFAETIEENKLRHQQRDRALRSHERQVSPRGLTPAERHDIARRFADPNTLACEWPYVWEQFERDIPRETLFIEDTAYRNADDALAAILSYVEYCYDRGQQHIQEKSAAALAAARSSDAAPTTPTTAAAAAGGDTASPPRERTFFESFFSVSTAAIKGAVVTMRASLPDFVGDPLLSVSGYDPALYHASRLFPTDPRARSERIFSAVREVVLASQQSFMGFPYQLLCEQVGTERLGLALEALERDQDEDDGDLDEETAQGAIPPEEPRNAEPPEAEVASPCVVSAPIPIARTEEAELTGRASSSAMHSPLRGSRVLRVYHSFSTSSLTNRAANEPRHHHHHTAHAVDEWDVSSTSSPVSDVAPSTMTPDGSPTVASRTTASPATVNPPPPPPPPPPPNGDDVVTERHRSVMESSNRKPLTRPPPLRETTRQLPAAPPGALAHGVSDEDRRRKDDMARRRRERRRRRRGQLPLLVGEPRPHEFAAFLDLLRSRVLAKQVKEDRKAKEQHRRERVQRMLERQREQWLSAPASQHGSRRVSRHTSSTSIDTMKQTDVAPPALTSHHAEVAATTPRSLFRDDVEGSAYLIPTQSPTAAVEPIVRSPQSPLSSALTRELATSPEMRGMRICLFFDAKRNVPMVMVNKLFRLFTVPGLRGLTSSEDDNERRATAAEELEGEIAEEEESAARRGDGRRAATANLVGRGRVGGVEKSLLLLIQVQFSLFTHEEAEVRWKWWKL